MKKYRCIIADDNLLERDALAMHLGKLEQVEVVAACEDGHEALTTLQKEEIDLVLSDVEMPYLSGFDVLKSLKNAPVFIFISSHGEFAIESYNLDVVDFIVKPVTFPRVLKAVNKAIEYLELKRGPEERLPAAPVQEETYFFIRESNDLVKLEYDEVAYIESMGDFSKIFTTDDRKHITLVSLKNLEIQLPPAHFTRVHKQHIINHHHISAITTDEVKVAGRYLVPLSQSFRQELMDKVVNKKVLTRHVSK